jgi:hypothetical protein
MTNETNPHPLKCTDCDDPSFFSLTPSEVEHFSIVFIVSIKLAISGLFTPYHTGTSTKSNKHIKRYTPKAIDWKLTLAIL